jgi:1,4-alpha-glucan branching enzyme
MKMKAFIILFLSVVGYCSLAQSVAVTPEISPALFKYNDQITVTYDVTGKTLANLSTAYIWVWIPGKNTNAKYNINPATAAADPAKFTKSVAAGKTTFTITFKPSDFFAASISAETKLGMLIKGPDWANGQSTDYVADLWDGSFQIKLTSPAQQPLFVDNGEQILITAETPLAADYSLYVNDVLQNSQSSLTKYSFTHTVTETSGYATVKLVATSGSSDDVTFQYIISNGSTLQPRPAGIIPGINYNSSDHTKVTLCLWAPDKSSVYVRGDFSTWQVLPENQMKRDGEYFWIEISGLTSGTEYAFQYLVDENIYVADPYADKILDADNDQYIPAATYPSLKVYPDKARSDKWYFNKVSVFQTNQTPYQWQVTNFTKPVKENLVVYELLVRDYFADGKRNYQNLIDTLAYIKRLGVTAIELMPIMEFAGNDSWGYNPVFMFAPDKYYGTKDKFKEFIDVCHQNGIAVILDIAMNHQDMPNPYLMMDFNYTTLKPNPTNKFFNVDATHPFSVFFDMNHESSYTKAYLDTINYHWLNEYKVDGFRFDLSKGFTQTNNPGNVGAWGNYDASRIAILKRMADKIWAHSPNAYVILEHFAANTEEKELAEYRIGEGKGMMLWGNLNNAYAQNSMGYATSSDISWISHTSRGWSTPHVVGYMESHDEERLMVKNLQSGNASGNYNIKTLPTALKRIEAASTIFYTIPGPKMLWQFGELGYDYSINYCPDGSNNSNCRVSAKPVKWEYQDDKNRDKLYDHVSDLIRLRNTYDVFTNGTPTFEGMSALTKQVMVKNNPYVSNPTTAGDMNAVMAVNFDVTAKNITVTFPHTGTWFDYYDGGSPLTVTGANQVVSFDPGQYRIFTDVFLPESPIITALEEGVDANIALYPNPVEDVFTIELDNKIISEVKLRTLQGATITPSRISKNSWNVSGISPGLYVVEIESGNTSYWIKMIKK